MLLRGRSTPLPSSSSSRTRSHDVPPHDHQVVVAGMRGGGGGGGGGRVVKAVEGQAEEMYRLQVQYNERMQRHWELDRRTLMETAAGGIAGAGVPDESSFEGEHVKSVCAAFTIPMIIARTGQSLGSSYVTVMVV
ncbi:hypothetical protein CEUSTIGMA_g4089.t1 [Chlamydomonas eustigma]|uniref:Uncharacterized protein n=1 Tax=Chlamydomonas eustigma TaxID=1157962 RepID=A0A250X0P5_9CHLO|nr:hypothetical protein CEUSTIGMA_g4089.t1 [Chlamydomonas eustigma]|eukprot:GAX76643.1 hypothetical protein CEUSTIGMA_g4089.t1 [Chlamydomonas eustigma]